MKTTKSLCTYLLFASCLGTLMGCNKDMLFPTMGDVKEFSRIDSERHDRHDKAMTDQHKIQTPKLAAEIQAIRDNAKKEFERLDKETAEIESNLLPLMKEVPALLAKLLGVPDSVINTLTGKLGPKIAAAQKEADAAMSGVKNNATALRETKVHLATYETALMELSKETADKFALATADTIARLDKVREDRAAFEKILRDDLKLSPAEISDLKGMSTEQIMAMIAAAVTAAGIGVAGGRGGKSRSHEDVEKLKNKIAALTANIELHKPAPKG